VPGRIDSPRSKGCHDLIKKGAKASAKVRRIFSASSSICFPRATNRQARPGCRR
jgi:predicted Rossmann fold nucleotide-binding protein DprA/Smf involved in DNA uptake